MDLDHSSSKSNKIFENVAHLLRLFFGENVMHNETNII